MTVGNDEDDEDDVMIIMMVSTMEGKLLALVLLDGLNTNINQPFRAKECSPL